MAPTLTLIGTGHVFRIGPAVRDAVLALAPDVVFVELDRGRYHALMERRAGKAPPTGATFVQRRLQAFQESVAGAYGAQVGEEMLAAVDAGRMVGAQVRLIDPPAEDTLRDALRALTWRERARAAGLLVGGAAKALWPSRRTKDRLEDELAKYQQDPEATLAELERTFPSIHRVVIAERDRVMAERIRAGMARHERGVAVVGDGHVPGLLRRLEDLGPTAFRLGDVRDGRLPKPGNSTFSFGHHTLWPGP